MHVELRSYRYGRKFETSWHLFNELWNISGAVDIHNKSSFSNESGNYLLQSNMRVICGFHS